MTDNVRELPASTNFTVYQALRSALDHTDTLESVFIIGFDSNGDIFVRSSKALCKDGLWAAKKLEQHALGLDDD